MSASKEDLNKAVSILALMDEYARSRDKDEHGNDTEDLSSVDEWLILHTGPFTGQRFWMIYGEDKVKEMLSNHTKEDLVNLLNHYANLKSFDNRAGFNYRHRAIEDIRARVRDF